MKRTGRIEGIAALGIGCAVDDTAYLRPANCARTHRARLNGDVECSLGHVFASQRLCRSGDSLYLCVRRDIGECLGEIVSTTDDLVLADDDATYRYLVGGKCLARLLK